MQAKLRKKVPTNVISFDDETIDDDAHIVIPVDRDVTQKISTLSVVSEKSCSRSLENISTEPSTSETSSDTKDVMVESLNWQDKYVFFHFFNAPLKKILIILGLFIRIENYLKSGF